ncbi:MAG TPA: toprim domain-containing protein [Candidatus Paceibacterota bacterium]|nr:toprim domain-containing protein [Candidatus Paceibacterota bacterium]
MNSIQRLAELLSELPGIGPRQSKRIVYHLLTRRRDFLNELSDRVRTIADSIAECASCHRFYEKGSGNGDLCSICGDPHRDRSLLMIVARDADLDSMEKAKGYNGLYFVLGGTVPILEKEPRKTIREDELLKTIERYASTLKEIIFALNANPEGENTETYLTRELDPQKEKYSLGFSKLGRGLSTGSELEYADKNTLQNALQNRH